MKSIATLLQSETNIEQGRALHDHIIKIGLDHNQFFENMTLNMYGRCGALEDAHFMFLSSSKDTAAWNAMISVYTQYGFEKDALQLFNEMLHQSIKLTIVTFMSVLSSCNHPSALMDGFMVHSHLVENGFEGNPLLGSALVTMYGKCGSVEAALIMFHKLYHRNVISWTTMITILADSELGEDAFRLFELMQGVGISPTNITLLSVICGFHNPYMLDMGNMVHGTIVKLGFDTDSFIGTSLIKMYGEMDLLEDAQHVFDKLNNRTVVSWNVLIDAYAQNDQGQKAVELFWEMHDVGIKPDDGTFVSVLNACLSLNSIMDGKVIHSRIKATQYEHHVVVTTALVNMYGRFGDLDEAYSVFMNMKHRNTVSWNTFLSAYTQNGMAMEPLQSFYQMLQEGIMVNKLTYLSILTACEMLSALEECRRFHAMILCSEHKMDCSLQTAIINVYGKCGELEEASVYFDSVQQRSLVLWNVMISAYVQHCHDKKALELFDIMQMEKVGLDESMVVSLLKACSNLSTYDKGMSIHASAIKMGFDNQIDVGTALVTMYGKWGMLEEANLLFSGLDGRNVITWNALIAVYAQYGHIQEAMHFMQKMNGHVQPDKFTFISILNNIGTSSTIEEGKYVHALIVSEGLEQCTNVGTALISMYGECGDIEAARLVFDKMYEQSVVAWNCMLSTYAQLGLGKIAFNLYLDMLNEGLKPNAVTFLCILSACSHSGLLEEGLSCFASMKDDYKIEPKAEHFGCIVDLYGRLGELKEAERFIHRMQIEHHTLVWRTLLGACKRHNNVEIGIRAAEHALILDPKSPTPYILLSDLLTENQMWDEIAALKERMIQRGLGDFLDGLKAWGIT
ncbi:hypothetical protein KP509_06G033000 [Ceratopteris richardii]|nr:hypothetical protein KP509_06G033000 [Ceratopteris richardii]